MERILLSKQNSETASKYLVSQYEVDKIEAISKPRCLFQIQTFGFSHVHLDLSKRVDFRYSDIAKIEVSHKNNIEFTIYLLKSKKSLIFQTTERGQLLCDLSYFHMLFKYEDSVRHQHSKQTEFINPVLKEKALLFNDMYDDGQMSGVKCNIVILATYLVIESD
jgi:hypothetical protein